MSNRSRSVAASTFKSLGGAGGQPRAALRKDFQDFDSSYRLLAIVLFSCAAVLVIAGLI